jgi:hypothetical protein
VVEPAHHRELDDSSVRRGLSVASKTSGVNVDLLTADGSEKVEHLFGMVYLTGILVDVKPAAAASDANDWSGITEPSTAGRTFERER